MTTVSPDQPQGSRRRAAALIACAWLALAWMASGSSAAAEKLPPKEKFHVYLLIGQSNMAGRGQMTDEDRTPREGILMLNAQNEWVPAAHPLHFDKPIAGVGLGLPFAEAIAKQNPGVTIGLIPCAVGGTPLSRWSKDGDLYKAAVNRAKKAMADGQLRGILWHQGESDSSRAETASTYAKRLVQMIADLREELAAQDVPFVAGELGEFYVQSEHHPHAKTVNAALQAIGQHAPRAACASATGLGHKGDQVHFSREALQTFGQRYAEAMLKLQSASSKPGQ